MTSQITSAIARDGVYAVLVLMALDAFLPLGGELTMLYAGVLTAGAAGAHVTVLGAQVPFGAESYVVLVAAGTIGSLVGALAAYAVGAWGGRALLDRRWLRLNPEALARAEGWLERHGGSAMLVGRVTPVVRSFISLPAGVLRYPFGEYTLLTLLGSLAWCLAFAAAGWALGSAWESLHSGFRYVQYTVVVAVLALIGAAMVRRRRRAATQ